jgi:hypothetical protein
MSPDPERADAPLRWLASARADLALAAADLTPYAVTTRYPGEVEPVTAEERTEAVRAATIVVHWAESLLTKHGL